MTKPEATAPSLLRAHWTPALAAHSTDALDAVTQRLHDACLTVACLPPDGPRGFFSTWPAYRLEWWDEGNEASKLSDADIARRLLKPPRFTPTPRQVDDCLPALALLDGVTRTERRVVAARAVQLWNDLDGGWRAVGRACGVSHTAARRLHWSAMLLALARSTPAVAAPPQARAAKKPGGRARR